MSSYVWRCPAIFRHIVFVLAAVFASVMLFVVSVSAAEASSSTFTGSFYATAGSSTSAKRTTLTVPGSSTTNSLYALYYSPSTSASVSGYFDSVTIPFTMEDSVSSGTNLVVSGSYTMFSFDTSYLASLTGYSSATIALYGVPYLSQSGDYELIHTFSASEWSASFSSGYLTYKVFAEVVVSGQYTADFQVVISWPNTLKYTFSGLSSGYHSLSSIFVGVSASIASYSNSFSLGSSEASVGGSINSAAADIISSIDTTNMELEEIQSMLLEIKNYLYNIYQWYFQSYTDSDGITWSTDWNYFVATTYKFLYYIQDYSAVTAAQLLQIRTLVSSFVNSWGYTTDETFRTCLESYFYGVIYAIENQTDEILSWLEENTNADTSAVDSSVFDVSSGVASLDSTEDSLFSSASTYISSVDLTSVSLGSQTVTALAALSPVYENLFNVSGEVGLVIVLSLVVGIVLLIIGRTYAISKKG